MNLIFGDAASLHRHVLKFASRSEKNVQYNGTEYPIHHTQFGTYDLQNAFTTVIENTDSDPRFDKEFKKEVQQAIKKSIAVIDEDLTYHYNRREFVKPRELQRAASKYYQQNMSNDNRNISNLYVMEPNAENRIEAIAEVFTLMHASKADTEAFIQFHGNCFGDDDDDNVPNTQVNTDMAAFAFRDTTLQLHGCSTLKRPDPSMHTIRAIYELYEDIGLRQNVREVYGMFVSPEKPQSFKPSKSTSREFLSLGRTNSIEKWTSTREPPLESLDN